MNFGIKCEFRKTWIWVKCEFEEKMRIWGKMWIPEKCEFGMKCEFRKSLWIRVKMKIRVKKCDLEFSFDHCLIFWTECKKSGHGLSSIEIFQFLAILNKTRNVMPLVIGTISFGSLGIVFFFASADLIFA